MNRKTLLFGFLVLMLFGVSLSSGCTTEEMAQLAGKLAAPPTAAATVAVSAPTPTPSPTPLPWEDLPPIPPTCLEYPLDDGRNFSICGADIDGGVRWYNGEILVEGSVRVSEHWLRNNSSWPAWPAPTPGAIVEAATTPPEATSTPVGVTPTLAPTATSQSPPPAAPEATPTATPKVAPGEPTPTLRPDELLVRVTVTPVVTPMPEGFVIWGVGASVMGFLSVVGGLVITYTIVRIIMEIKK